jgi:lipopolysaccharide export system protein LptA
MRALPLVLFAIACLSTPAAAQIGRQGGPIDITADRTEFLDQEGVSRWIGKVDVRQGDARLVADQMDVYFQPGPDGGPGEITRIVATGSVAYITPREVARGQHGVYSLETDRMEIEGDVVLIRGENTLTGEKLIVEPSLGRAFLDSEVSARGVSGGNRVRAVFDSAEVEGENADETPAEAQEEPAEDGDADGGAGE